VVVEQAEQAAPRTMSRTDQPVTAATTSHGGFVHPAAVVEDGATLGEGTKVWANVQIRTGAHIGRNCIFGRNSFVDAGVTVGDHVKVQNNASLYEGVTIEDGVFVGPHVIFTNDKVPRAVTPTGALKTADDWELGRIVVRHGAAIGAGAVIVTGVVIGRWAMIGSGTVVTRDVPDHALVLGNPGRVVGYVSAAGDRFETPDQARAATQRETERETGREAQREAGQP
jgi:UDP-2-acetamido-3-amino-2,3-dideoxy-glucuronate N-acetyltransferase